MKRPMGIAVIMLVVLSLFAGCAHPSQAPKEPKVRDTLVILYMRHPESLDPHACTMDNPHERVIKNLYEPLVGYKPGTIDLVGILAESWEYSPDGKALTFKLRAGVKFHDGTQLDAEAVRLSFQRVLDLGLARASYLRPVESFETPDRMTFRINLKEPSASFIHTLNQICVVSGKALKEHYNDAWLKTHAVGTGPYKIDDFQPNADKLTFTKFEDYWRGWEGKHVSRVESIVVPESATQRMMLEKGEADFMERYPIEYNFEIKDDHPNCSVLLFDTLRTSVLPLNTVTGPLTDIRLRKALMYAFPYEKFVDEYYRGMAEASVGPVPPKMLPDPNRKPFKQDLSKAKELLAEAGYANGVLTLTYYWPSGGSEQKMPGIMLQDALRGLGVELKMVEMPWPSIVERVTKKETLPDVMTLINTPFAADPASGLLHQFYHSSRVGATYNWGWYVNPKVDQLLDEAERTLDDVKRLDLARQIQQIVIDDAAGIFIAYPKKWFIVSKGLKGVKYNLISMEWYPWYDMYIEK